MLQIEAARMEAEEKRRREAEENQRILAQEQAELKRKIAEAGSAGRDEKVGIPDRAMHECRNLQCVCCTISCTKIELRSMDVPGP